MEGASQRWGGFQEAVKVAGPGFLSRWPAALRRDPRLGPTWDLLVRGMDVPAGVRREWFIETTLVAGEEMQAGVPLGQQRLVRLMLDEIPPDHVLDIRLEGHGSLAWVARQEKGLKGTEEKGLKGTEFEGSLRSTRSRRERSTILRPSSHCPLPVSCADPPTFLQIVNRSQVWAQGGHARVRGGVACARCGDQPSRLAFLPVILPSENGNRRVATGTDERPNACSEADENRSDAGQERPF